MIKRFLDATKRAGLNRDAVLLGATLHAGDQGRLLDVAVELTEGAIRPERAVMPLAKTHPEVFTGLSSRFDMTSADTVLPAARWLLAVAMGASEAGRVEVAAAA